MQSIGEYQYRQGDLIGSGAFALVYKGHHKQSGSPVAVKQILLKKMPTKLSNSRQEEMSILKDLKHTNIVQLFYYHELPTEIYLIIEFCNGGDLAEYLLKKETLSEMSIKHLTRHIAGALQAIHQRQIIHRDIKPQNILLSFRSTSSTQSFKDATIKLADFGFARYLSSSDMAATLCGSPLYMAPEILLGRRYDSKVDLWSTGTILYQCLTGEAPFKAPNPYALRRKYLKESLIPRIPNGTSETLADLLFKLLKKNNQERLSHVTLLSHPFLQNTCTYKELSQDYSPPTFHAKSSPVPIQRQHQTTHSGYQHTSPHSLSRESQITSYNKYISPSSGPPSIHKIGSNSSLTYTSPPTKDIEDFVMVYSKSGDINSSISDGTPSSCSSLPFNSNMQWPLSTELQTKVSTPPSSLHLRKETPPFSSLLKLTNESQLGSPQTTPSSFQATPSSSSSSPISSKPFESPGISRRSNSRHDNSAAARLPILRETTPTIGDSLDISASHSLLLTSDSLQKGFDFILKNKTTSSPEDMFNQLQNEDIMMVARKREMEEDQLSQTLSSNSNSSGNVEEMFALEEDYNDKYLVSLKHSILIGQELLKIAKSRHGPMMLLSSSMGDSYGMLNHAQRFTEQLILCVKATNVVECGIREYEISLAAHSIDPKDNHLSALKEAQTLQEDCLTKARLARELYSKCLNRQRQSLPQTKVTAERLIFLQVVDMCKQTILKENSLQEKEVKRRYWVSHLLLQLLLSDASTERDRITLKKYITNIQEKLKTLSSSSSD